MHLIGPAGKSGYALGATWLEILLATGGSAEAVAIGVWLARC